MNSISQMVGYDVRLAPRARDPSDWDSERRQLFLVRPDVAYPLAVDAIVWPSRFYLGPSPQVAAATARQRIPISPATGNSHFRLFNLWDDRDEMINYYVPDPDTDCILGVGTVRPERYPADFTVDLGDWWSAIHGSPVQPDEMRPGWQLLGYDLADTGLTSFLSNYGFAEPQRSRINQRWQKCINDHGLVASLDDALQCCAQVNKDYSEGAPFYVFELFLIPHGAADTT